MPTDIEERARQDRLAFDAVAGQVRNALQDARDGGDPAAPAVADAVAAHLATTLAAVDGDPDPGDAAFVDPAAWADTFSPADHLDLARGALAGVRGAQAAVRAELTAVTTPADTDRLEAKLRALLIVDSSLRVDQRHANERVVAQAAHLQSLSTLLDEVDGHVRGVVEREQWAAAQQALTDALRERLTDPPLDQVVADADAVRTGDVLGDADDRLGALLPDELRARAVARAAEAVTVLETARAAADATRSALDDLALAGRPLAAEVDIAVRDHDTAVGSLQDYVVGATTRLEMAVNLLVTATAHPDLSAAQAAALDVAANAAGKDAADDETDLVAAIDATAAAQRTVDDALLAAVVDDPDGDPEEADDVEDARGALDATQGALDTARTAVDASQDALDQWEVEVPATLWAALADVERARAILDGLADQAARDQLVADLDDAEIALADAIDALGVHIRTIWLVRMTDAARRAALAAAERSGADRHGQFVRGDGTGGRTAAQR